ncbi:MAG: VOC family protein [Candidatus Marinimicrobia bacterium]|nr:VOC family protein [Candidatus Neomarinimicrobiota bacterium]
MIDHITLRVKNISKSKVFYDSLLQTIGYKIVLGKDDDPFRGYGPVQDPVFEIVQADEIHPSNSNVHIAFKVLDKKTIKLFHQKALELGGVNNGEPGPRPIYGETYYASFILDPDGNNIEACLY